MKGIVFTEFLEMVEDRFGFLVTDKIIEKAQLKSKGAYTAVGTYDHQEMVRLVDKLSQEVDISVDDLFQLYGQHFFHVLVKSYPRFFENVPTAFDFLKSIENHIHVEVLKLYPDAELPKFNIEEAGSHVLQMTYYSSRKLYKFAQGLIEGCLQHYKQEATVELELIKADGSEVKFTLTKK
jgi:hypothetical protein